MPAVRVRPCCMTDFVVVHELEDIGPVVGTPVPWLDRGDV